MPVKTGLRQLVRLYAVYRCMYFPEGYQTVVKISSRSSDRRILARSDAPSSSKSRRSVDFYIPFRPSSFFLRADVSPSAIFRRAAFFLEQQIAWKSSRSVTGVSWPTGRVSEISRHGYSTILAREIDAVACRVYFSKQWKGRALRRESAIPVTRIFWWMWMEMFKV